MPASPILLLVPYRNKAAVLYSQIPTSASASGDMVVSRAGVSTRVNAQGNIESVAANVPRLNYPLGGVANGCPALLVEPTVTNIARWVNQMTAQDFAPGVGGTTITTGSTDFLAPDGTSGSITKYVGGAASGSTQYAYYTGGPINATTGGAHVFSLFVKRGTTNPVNFCSLSFSSYTGLTQTFISYFNLASGTALTAGASIQDYGNGWYRCISAPYIMSASDLSGQLLFSIAEGNNDPIFPASGALGLTAYTWGAQLELGVAPTSYIPTTTAAVTRNADIVTNNTFVIPNLIGAILTEFDSPTSGTYFLDNIPIPIASGSNKIAISYTPTTLTIYRNGAQVSGSPVTPPGGTAPVIGNVINIGHNNQLYQLGSGIKSFVLYSSTLSAAEASGLTT
jgi:hypothetical protein